MFFSINNLTIIYMTVIVIFFNGYSDGSIETCQDELESLNFQKSISPSDNLFNIFNNKFNEYDEVPKYIFQSKNRLQENEKIVAKIIDLLNQKSNIYDSIYGSKYILHLKENILNPENWLSVVTWCDINVLTKNDTSLFESDEIATGSIDKYNNYYIQRIANNTSLPRKDRLAVFKTLRVCFKEINNKKSEYYQTYYKKFIAEKRNDLEPLSWCAINVCYNSLIKSEFKDVPVNQNIDLINLKKNKFTETYNRYAFLFHEYFQEFNKKKDLIVSPYESNIFINYGKIKNWCNVQVCYDDLTAAGFIYWHASDNYFYVYPEYEKNKDSKFFSKYVIAYCNHLKHIWEVNNQMYKDNCAAVQNSFKYFANAEPRSPKYFCIFYINDYVKG